MTGIRDKLIHDYLDVDLNIVYQTVSVDTKHATCGVIAKSTCHTGMWQCFLCFLQEKYLIAIIKRDMKALPAKNG